MMSSSNQRIMEVVITLYAFDAQSAGELSFRKGSFYLLLLLLSQGWYSRFFSNGIDDLRLSQSPIVFSQSD